MNMSSDFVRFRKMTAGPCFRIKIGAERCLKIARRDQYRIGRVENLQYQFQQPTDWLFLENQEGGSSRRDDTTRFW